MCGGLALAEGLRVCGGLALVEGLGVSVLPAKASPVVYGGGVGPLLRDQGTLGPQQEFGDTVQSPWPCGGLTLAEGLGLCVGVHWGGGDGASPHDSFWGCTLPGGWGLLLVSVQKKGLRSGEGSAGWYLGSFPLPETALQDLLRLESPPVPKAALVLLVVSLGPGLNRAVSLGEALVTAHIASLCVSRLFSIRT